MVKSAAAKRRYYVADHHHHYHHFHHYHHNHHHHEPSDHHHDFNRFDRLSSTKSHIIAKYYLQGIILSSIWIFLSKLRFYQISHHQHQNDDHDDDHDLMMMIMIITIIIFSLKKVYPVIPPAQGLNQRQINRVSFNKIITIIFIVNIIVMIFTVTA